MYYLAHRCHHFGDYHDLVFEALELGDPGDHELVLDTRAAAVAFHEMLMVQGLYQLRPPLPFTPGSECAGVVVSVGRRVTRFKPGDRVIANVRFGAQAEKLIAPEEACLPLPDAFDFATGSAFTTAYKTAYVALVVRGALREGETLLVHGAGGGVGLAAVELGKLLGATVIASAASPEKLAAARAQGADHVIDTRDGGFRDAVKAVTGGRGADVIYDPVGGDLFDESLHCIAPFGRVLVIGFAGGRIPQVAANYVLIKQISIVGVRAGEYGRQNPVGGAAVNRALFDLAQAGRLHPHIHARLPFGDLIKAFDALASRRVIGRIVLERQP